MNSVHELVILLLNSRAVSFMSTPLHTLRVLEYFPRQSEKFLSSAAKISRITKQRKPNPNFYTSNVPFNLLYSQNHDILQSINNLQSYYTYTLVHSKLMTSDYAKITIIFRNRQEVSKYHEIHLKSKYGRFQCNLEHLVEQKMQIWSYTVGNFVRLLHEIDMKDFVNTFLTIKRFAQEFCFDDFF